MSTDVLKRESRLDYTDTEIAAAVGILPRDARALISSGSLKVEGSSVTLVVQPRSSAHIRCGSVERRRNRW